MATMREFYFPSFDQASRLYARLWLPESGSPRAVIQLVHGIAEHIGRYDHFARFLADQGYAVTAEDHLGHGRSASGPEELGFTAPVDGWAKMVDNIHALHALTREQYPDLPYVMLGHSMGSFLTRTYLICYPGELDACILSGTGSQPPAVLASGLALVRMERRRLGDHGRSTLLQNLCFGAYNNRFKPVRTPSDWISRDEAVVDLYRADPFCTFTPTVTLMGDMLGGIRFIQKPEHLAKMDRDLPILFFSGDRDPVGSAGKGVQQAYRAFLSAGCTDVTCKLYPEGRHEMLNELNRDEVYQDILQWLDEKLAAERGASD